MQREEIRQKISDFMRGEFKKLSQHEFKDSEDLRWSLGLDSLDLIELVVAAEELLGISIDETEILEVETFGQMIDVAHRLATEQGVK